MNLDNLSDLKEALENSWGKKTCYPNTARQWGKNNAAQGQCAVTALVVHDYYGGKILRCWHKHHYWNMLPNNQEVDFTRQQFRHDEIVCKDQVVAREQLLKRRSADKAKTHKRYKLLKRKVEQYFDSGK